MVMGAACSFPERSAAMADHAEVTRGSGTTVDVLYNDVFPDPDKAAIVAIEPRGDTEQPVATVSNREIEVEGQVVGTHRYDYWVSVDGTEDGRRVRGRLVVEVEEPSVTPFASFVLNPPDGEVDFGLRRVDEEEPSLSITFTNDGDVALSPSGELVHEQGNSPAPSIVTDTLADSCGLVQPGRSCEFSLTLSTSERVDLAGARYLIMADPAPAREFLLRGRVTAQTPSILAIPAALRIYRTGYAELTVINKGSTAVAGLMVEPGSPDLSVELVELAACHDLEPDGRCTFQVTVSDAGREQIPFDNEVTISGDGQETTVPVEVIDQPHPRHPWVKLTRCGRRSEDVVIVNDGPEDVSLIGWRLTDATREDTLRFDDGHVLAGGGGTMRVLSGPAASEGGDGVIWTTAEVYDDHGDAALLWGPAGERFICVCTDD